MAAAARTEQASHSLLDELRGVLHRLKSSSHPIQDGHTHLVPLCESLEAVLRTGLKQPNSWFGLNKQDYWSWIEPLQDYYFNEKQNPLLRQIVVSVVASGKLRTVVGRGRCFLRVALCQKLLSVPVEHLVKNSRLTQYWYTTESIIAKPALVDLFMKLLFELTELDFQLNLDHSSFLDETWTIPVYQLIHLPPIRTLDLKVAFVDSKAVVVEIEQGSLAQKNGVEVGDIIDELCGEAVHDATYGKMKQILVSNSVDSTDLTVVKRLLADGSPFFPILRRQLVHDSRASSSSSSSSPLTPSPLLPPPSSPFNVQTQGSGTEYQVVYLGRDEQSHQKEKPSQEALDAVISCVLHSSRKPEEVLLRVSSSEVTILTAQGREPLVEFGYGVVSGCGSGALHQTCFVLLAGRGKQEGGGGGGGERDAERMLVAHVCEAPSTEMAQGVCAHIAQGFNRSLWLRDKQS